MQPANQAESGKDLTTQQARQGATLGVMRYVLAISTIAVALIFAWIWLSGT
jgi:hypothetical protein